MVQIFFIQITGKEQFGFCCCCVVGVFLVGWLIGWLIQWVFGGFCLLGFLVFCGVGGCILIRIKCMQETSIQQNFTLETSILIFLQNMLNLLKSQCHSQPLTELWLNHCTSISVIHQKLQFCSPVEVVVGCQSPQEGVHKLFRRLYTKQAFCNYFLQSYSKEVDKQMLFFPPFFAFFLKQLFFPFLNFY